MSCFHGSLLPLRGGNLASQTTPLPYLPPAQFFIPIWDPTFPNSTGLRGGPLLQSPRIPCSSFSSSWPVKEQGRGSVLSSLPVLQSLVSILGLCQTCHLLPLDLIKGSLMDAAIHFLAASLLTVITHVVCPHLARHSSELFFFNSESLSRELRSILGNRERTH